MNIEAQESAINGELIKLTRESRGWALGELATRSCMSIRQIRQLEEGGTSSFYSVGVKVTAAKRVASLLGLSPEQVFEIPKTPADSVAGSAPVLEVPAHADTPLVLVSPNVMVSQAESDALSDVSSHLEEAVHRAKPLAPELGPEHDPQLMVATTSDAELAPQASAEAAVQAPAEPEKSKVSFAAILLLFAAALGVAAVMRPELESVGVESAPPVLAVPTEEAPQASPSLTPASVSVAAAEAASVAASASVAKPAVAIASAPGVAGPAAPASAQPRVAASAVSSNPLAATAVVASQPRVATAASAASGAGSSSKSP